MEFDLDMIIPDRIVKNEAWKASTISSLRASSADPRVLAILEEADCAQEWLLAAVARARLTGNTETDKDITDVRRVSQTFATGCREPSEIERPLHLACVLCGAAKTKEDLDFAFNLFKKEYAIWEKRESL